MLDRLELPPLLEIAHLEGKGNYAVKKYYAFPFSLFYRHKLKMILKYLNGKRYGAILDFGGGEPQIFNKTLRKYSSVVHCADRKEEINTAMKYDVIVCASVLEFVWLSTTVPVLKAILKPSGMILIASPMRSKLSNFYFNLIKDKGSRSSHEQIMGVIRRYFKVVSYNEWFGLYFSCKAVHK